MGSHHGDAPAAAVTLVVLWPPRSRTPACDRRFGQWRRDHPPGGCVILDRSGQVAGIGRHERTGPAHAETEGTAGPRADAATAMITLQPSAEPFSLPAMKSSVPRWLMVSRLSERWWSKSNSCDLRGWEPRRPDAAFAAVGITGSDFALQAGGQELLVGPVFGAGAFGQSLDRSGQRRGLQRPGSRWSPGGHGDRGAGGLLSASR